MTTIKLTNILKLLGIAFAIPVCTATLLVLYIYVGTLTGFFEWKDTYHVRHYKLGEGVTLQRVVETRLVALGVNRHINWSAACYGPTAIVTACTDDSFTNCLAFDYYHGDTVLSGNKLAVQIVPELKHGRGNYGVPLDNVSLDSLK